MAEVENHFTVFIRLPFDRGNFIDPPPVAWSAAKERALWDVISRQGQGKGNEIDWHALASQFEVSQPFILQQAAWLYERQLSQVRAQLRKVGNRQSATASPASASLTSSMVGGQAMRRAGSGGGSRVPSRLSTLPVGSPKLVDEGSAPPTPAKSRNSVPLRGASGALPVQGRPGLDSSRPLSRQASKEDHAAHSQSRRGSTQHQLSRSPGQGKAVVQASDSEDDDSHTKLSSRRANPSGLRRRSVSYRKDAQAQSPKPNMEPGEEDEESPTLPFAANRRNDGHPQDSRSAQDPGATIRGGYAHSAFQRPSTHLRTTSDHIAASKKNEEPEPIGRAKQQHMSSSTSSMSSNSNPAAARASTHPPNVRRASRHPNVNTLSPRQQAALASAGLSPRRHGSESSPSMGSSFSDLDDASVTQSALEEALMSGMGNTTTTLGGGVASRVSGISQALRSRYYDARGQHQAPPRESEQ